jgi:hypothetical protein
MEAKTRIEVVSVLLLLVVAQVAIILRTSSITTATTWSPFEYHVAPNYHGAIRQLL